MSEPEKKRPGNRLRADSRRQARSMRLRFVTVVAAVLLIASGFAWLELQPVSSDHRPIKVDIPKGSGVQGVADTLERSGIIRSALVYGLYVRLCGDAGRLKAGRYTLTGAMTLSDVTASLMKGPGRSGEPQIRVTIPEGYTLHQIASALERAGVTNAADFEKFARTPARWSALSVDFPLPKDTLEGYLYPDTYKFQPSKSPEAIAQEMLLNFSERFERPKHQQIEASGRDLHAIVTLASLIEREAKTSEDRPRIAGVINNRLRRNMKLEVDATVLYALGRHKSRVMDQDLKVDSPYNTYLHAGLPPGPIANPGLSSLLAALSPQQNDYLYYVARPTGAHIFTRTREEHDAAVRQARAEWRGVNSGGDSGG